MLTILNTEEFTSSNSVNPKEIQFHQTLERLGYAQLKAVRCEMSGDEMILRGQLDSFYLKQVAQSIAIKIPGVRCVRNEIQVD